MAASSLNAVRVRLYFDYPPPAVSECNMCWLFVDLNNCGMVADIVSVIREKFDFSRGTILNLFIDDCYLPPMETVYVLRDNDSIRVKVENQPPVNDVEASSKPEGQFQKANKRPREADEDNVGLRVKNKALTESQKVDPQPVGEAEMKKIREKSKEKTLPVKPEAAASMKRTTPVKSPAVSKSATMPLAMPPLPVAIPAMPAAVPAIPTTTVASRAAMPVSYSSSESSDSSEEKTPSCNLPPMESVRVLPDNDSIRVKVENQPPVNDIEASSKPEGQFQKANKRPREADEDNVGLRVKNTALTESQKVDPQPIVEAEEKEKKKKREKSKEKTLPVEPAAAAAPVKGTTPVKSPAVSKSAAMPVGMPPLPVAMPAMPAAVPAIPTTTVASTAAQQIPFLSSESSDSSEVKTPSCYLPPRKVKVENQPPVNDIEASSKPEGQFQKANKRPREADEDNVGLRVKNTALTESQKVDPQPIVEAEEKEKKKKREKSKEKTLPVEPAAAAAPVKGTTPVKSPAVSKSAAMPVGMPPLPVAMPRLPITMPPLPVAMPAMPAAVPAIPTTTVASTAAQQIPVLSSESSDRSEVKTPSCYLFPRKSVHVLRNNDSIRVKVENQPPVNDIEASSKPEGQFQKANKRPREADEDNVGLRVKNTALTESQKVDPQPIVEAKEKKKKKKREKSKEKTLPVEPAAAAAPVKGTTPVKSPAVSKSAAMPVAMPRLPITMPRLPVAMPRLPITMPRLPVAMPRLPITMPRLPIAMPRLPIAMPRLPVAMPAIPTTTVASRAAEEIPFSSSESSDSS